MPTAVGFDLDYTLAVPARSRARILEAAAERAGGPDLAEALTREAYLRAHRDHHVAETREPVFAALLADRAPDHRDARGGADAGTDGSVVEALPDRDGRSGDAPGTDAAELAGAYREEIAAALRPVEGVEALLADLGERYRVGLLTNGPAVAQRDKLRALGWDDRFDAVVITGEFGHAKPDPRPFRELCRRLGADPGETVYVGDEPDADVAGASGAGLGAVQVLGDDEFTRDEADPRADAAVRRPRFSADLPGILAGFDG